MKFYYTVDGKRSGEFVADVRSPKETLARLLNLMRTSERSTLLLAPIPADKDFLTYLHKEGGSPVYLQCAGTAEAMTIEWHKVDDDGQDRHYIVGRGGDHSGEPSVDIPFFDGNRTATVYPDEVFVADEATDIFFHYYETGRIPHGYELRWHDLTWPKPQP